MDFGGLIDQMNRCIEDHNEPYMGDENGHLPGKDKRKKRHFAPVIAVLLFLLTVMVSAGAMYRYFNSFLKNGVDCSLPKTISGNGYLLENDFKKKSTPIPDVSKNDHTQRIDILAGLKQPDCVSVLSNKVKSYAEVLSINAPPGYQDGERAIIGFYSGDKELLSDVVYGFPKKYRLSDIESREITIRVQYKNRGQHQTVSKKFWLDECRENGNNIERIACERDAHPDINELFSILFSARADGNLERMASIQKDISDEEMIWLKVRSYYVSEYRNLTCYTVPGLEENTYFAMVSYDMMVKDVDTPAPGLSSFYLKKDREGKWYLQEIDTLDENEREFCESFASKPWVEELGSEIDREYEKNLEDDPSLKYYLDEMSYYAHLFIEQFRSGTFGFT